MGLDRHKTVAPRGNLSLDTWQIASDPEATGAITEPSTKRLPATEPQLQPEAAKPILPTERPSAAASTSVVRIPVASWKQGTSEEQEEAGAGSAGIHIAGNAQSATSEGASFFSIRAQAASVIYVIDRSASMGLHGSLDVAKRELLASLEKLPASTRFQVVVYNRRAEPLPLDNGRSLALASPENKRRVALLLDELRAEGGTEHLNALKSALALQPQVVFFLTDADDLTLAQIHAITQINHGRSLIHTIELTDRTPSQVKSSLAVLARENGGAYQLAPAR